MRPLTWLPTALALTLVWPQTGCIGSFGLTHKIYSFNKEVSPDLVVQELLFLGMNIIPVYPVGVFIDAFVLNIVETFTGENPLDTVQQPHVIALEGGGQIAMTNQGRTLRIEQRIDGETTVLLLKRSRQGTELLDASGHLLRRVRSTSNGSILVEDGQGQLLSAHDRDEVLSVTAAWSLRRADAVAEAD